MPPGSCVPPAAPRQLGRTCARICAMPSALPALLCLGEVSRGREMEPGGLGGETVKLTSLSSRAVSEPEDQRPDT